MPPSVDSPHLIYRRDYFGAPIRNHADTEWMRERQLEALYRIRFDERRNTDHALLDLYEELAAGRDTDERAWLIIVAQPRIPVAGRQLDLAKAQAVVRDTEPRALDWVGTSAGVHPLEAVDRLNPRRGLRRWVLVNDAGGTRSWYEAWMAVHDSGAVNLAHAIGGQRIVGPEMTTLPGNRMRSRHIECAVSDCMALLREATKALGVANEYDLALGIEWTGDEPLIIETVDGEGSRFDGTSIALARYAKVRLSVRLDVDDEGFLAQASALTQDTVNHGGVQNVQAISGHQIRWARAGEFQQALARGSGRRVARGAVWPRYVYVTNCGW